MKESSSNEEETIGYKTKPKKKKIVYVESDSEDDVIAVKGKKSAPEPQKPRI